MADLTFPQSSDPVSIFNDSSGNQLVVNLDGSINTNSTVNTSQTTPDKYIITSFIKNSMGFSVAADVNAANAGSDNPILLIKNPNGSGKNIYLYSVIIGTQVANVSGAFKLFANPTITANGTAQTPKCSNVGSSTTSVMSTFTLSTISSNGSQLASAIQGENSDSADLIDDWMYIIQPNNNILITINPLSNNRLMTITANWIEV